MNCVWERMGHTIALYWCKLIKSSNTLGCRSPPPPPPSTGPCRIMSSDEEREDTDDMGSHQVCAWHFVPPVFKQIHTFALRASSNRCFSTAAPYYYWLNCEPFFHWKLGFLAPEGRKTFQTIFQIILSSELTFLINLWVMGGLKWCEAYSLDLSIISTWGNIHFKGLWNLLN